MSGIFEGKLFTDYRMQMKAFGSGGGGGGGGITCVETAGIRSLKAVKKKTNFSIWGLKLDQGCPDISEKIMIKTESLWAAFFLRRLNSVCLLCVKELKMDICIFIQP